ncbi:MAG: hypothetical protein ACR5LF_04765 [Symbiopectobacterium sp.]
MMTRLAVKSASWREPQHFAALPALLAFAYPYRIAQWRSADGSYQLASWLDARLPLNEPLAAQEWLIVPTLMLAEGGRALAWYQNRTSCTGMKKKVPCAPVDVSALAA